MRRHVSLLVNVALALAAFSVTTAATLHSRPAAPRDEMTLPALAGGQPRNILTILHADPYVQTLLRHRQYSVRRPAIWAMRKGTTLGGVVTVTFRRTIPVFSGRWLGLDYDCSETHAVPYGRRPYRATYEHVGGLTVWVDTVRHRVAGIAPTITVNQNSKTSTTHNSLTAVRRRQYYSETCHD